MLDALGITPKLEDERPLAFIVTLGEEAKVRHAAVKLLAELRAAGIAADMDYRSRKFGQQAKRADELGARYLLVLGDGELERGVIGLRDQSTKEQTDVPLAEITAQLQRLSAGGETWDRCFDRLGFLAACLATDCHLSWEGHRNGFLSRPFRR